MGFFFYDLIFLLLFCLVVGAFLYKNRKKLEVESKVLLLYRTKFGLNAIERASSKAPWLFRILAVMSITSGYLLMIGAVFLLVQTLILMFVVPSLPKIPPLMPLIPYLPSLFKIDFLPPFYFTYWIVSIAIVAISHEFMHGVFSRFYKIKLKSTGFGFLGPFLAAFVEPDEKEMAKSPPKHQIAILSGGSFANLIMAIVFFIILNLFFAAAFTQSGVILPKLNVNGELIESYMISPLNASLVYYNGQTLNLSQLKNENKSEYALEYNGTKYYLTKELINATPADTPTVYAYDNTPAYNSGIKGMVFEINGHRVRNTDEFTAILNNSIAGDTLKIKTTEGNYTIVLQAHPQNKTRGYLGIGFPQQQRGGLISRMIKPFLLKKEAFTYYKAKSTFSIFIYNLLLWIVLINVSVMFVNMLPFSIFDGGRFFYLTMLMITKSKKRALQWFGWSNNIILWILIGMMAVWAFRIF